MQFTDSNVSRSWKSKGLPVWVESICLGIVVPTVGPQSLLKNLTGTCVPCMVQCRMFLSCLLVMRIKRGADGHHTETTLTCSNWRCISVPVRSSSDRWRGLVFEKFSNTLVWNELGSYFSSISVFWSSWEAGEKKDRFFRPHCLEILI